jgi:hypothetical protein
LFVQTGFPPGWLDQLDQLDQSLSDSYDLCDWTAYFKQYFAGDGDRFCDFKSLLA